MPARPKYGRTVVRKARRYLENYEAEGDPFPSTVGLARVLGVSRMSLHRWRSNEQWDELMEKLSDEQERVLLNHGITGKFNSTICRLLLGRLGYSDRAQVEHTGRNGRPIQTITADMSDEEVRQAYFRMIHGEQVP